MSCFTGLVWRTSLVLLLMRPLLAHAQPLVLVPCTEVNLLGTACDEDEPLDVPGASPFPQAPEPPLFTLQTMHPSTPPLLIKVYNDPSPANRKAYLDWEKRYLGRIFEVDALLQEDRQQHKRSGLKE